MLLVWLFGIVVGVANACVAPSPGGAVVGPSRPVATSGSHHCDVMVTLADRAESAQSGQTSGHHGSSTKSNCQDVCEKSTISIPPQKLGLDGSADLPLLLPDTWAVAWSRPHEPAARLGELSRSDSGTATAITIAFLRLAL
jgi:hypothetical protein